MIKNCKNCGGNIYFVPNKKANVCDNCGSSFPVEYNYSFNKKSFEESVELKEDNFANEIKSIKCKSCGANMLLNKLETQKQCPYCGNTSITETRKNKLMYIDSIIPFEFSKLEILKKIKSYANNKFYINKSAFKKITENDIAGLYINSFVFDLLTLTSYSGVLSYEESYEDKDGNKKTKTSYKNIEGELDRYYPNITIEANSQIDQDDLVSIMPYNFNLAVDFKEDFMHGYILEYKNKMFEECFKMAEHIVKQRIEKEILKEYNCSKVVKLSINTVYLEKRYNYCLLPVYIASTNYKNKKYTTLVNGQTGKIGKIPLSLGRILLTILLVLGVIAGFVFLAMLFN